MSKNTKPLDQAELDRLAEEDYWHQRAMEEADYFAQQAQLQEREE